MMSDASMTDEVQEMEMKANGAKENQKFLAEFIEIYQAYPCLWKYNCRDYRNRNVKESAYRELVEKMREVDPRADKSSVIRKINVLRTAFRREYKKAKKAKVGKAKKKSESSLWYYDLMRFVVEGQEYPDAEIDMDEMNDWMNEGSASLDEEGKIVDHNAESLMEFLEEDTTHTEVKIEASSPTSSRIASPVIRRTLSSAMNLVTNNSGTGLQLEINDVYSEKNRHTILPLEREEPIISLQEPPPLAPISRPRRQLPVQPQQVQQLVPQVHQQKLAPPTQTEIQQTQAAPQQPAQAAQQQQAQQQQQSPQQQQQQQAQQLQPHSLQQIQQHVQLYQVEVEHADFDRFGTYVSAKLKRSTRKQSIIAEKVIAEVLMRANLGTLEETTRLTNLKE